MLDKVVHCSISQIIIISKIRLSISFKFLVVVRKYKTRVLWSWNPVYKYNGIPFAAYLARAKKRRTFIGHSNLEQCLQKSLCLYLLQNIDIAHLY